MKSESKYTLEKKGVGRLPMDLAESKENDNVNLSKRLITLLLKIIIIMLCIFLFFGVYFCVLWWLTSDINGLQNENIIVLTKFHKSSNATFVPEDFEIILRLRNKTRGQFARRKKRQVLENFSRRKHDHSEKVKNVLSEHKMLCSEKSHRDKCKEVMDRLKLVTQNHVADRKKKSVNAGETAYSNHRSDASHESDSIFRKQRNLQPSMIKSTKSHNHYYPHRPMNIYPANSEQYHNERSSRQLTDTCLLAKLMKQSFPHLHGVYDKPKFESHYPQIYSRHPSTLFDDEISNEHLQHPQDAAIEKVMNLKRDDASDEMSNITIRESRCRKDEFLCDNGEACVDAKQWCDGIVHCSDVSDETRCSCKDRVDETRICDGYFDCPLGEDEMGCFGCNENEFSCADGHLSRACFSQEQRCNNQADCTNLKDEMDCMMLSPKLHVKPLFAISNTEGFLKRNFQGSWYSVCSNPYMWAHDACRRETGLIIRPPIIQMVKIDPSLQISYINMLPGGVMDITDSCFNSSAVYVTCPDLLCGTRMQTNSQILRENMAVENSIYGRNKRFLRRGRTYSNLFFDKRDNFARHKGVADHIMNNSNGGNVRGKRTETRVVGGRPSQPAAWPWAVALYRDGVFHCGGVIINQNWIMSAAHCVHKFWQHYYEIRVGTLRRLSFSPQEQNHRVSHVIVNQKYSQEDMKNDISLLHVRPGIMFSRWVRPICLPSPEVAGFQWETGPQPGTMCVAVGWGATIERGPDPDHLREVEVPITHCNHREDLAGNEICAGFVDGGKDACQGDSGGPLLCKNPSNAQQWYIAGIVSHGDGCGRKDEPGVYTRVSLFVSWIRQHISSKTLPSIQPKQECPGFRCDSGIAKCLPKKRMCDEIIDCLDGEDEINCDYKNSENSRNVISISLDHDNHNIKSANLISNKNFSLESFKGEKKTESDLIDSHESKIIPNNSNIDSNENLILNSSKSGENFEKSSESEETLAENVTSDPGEITSENFGQFSTQSTTISLIIDTKLHEKSTPNDFLLTDSTKTTVINDFELNNNTNEMSTSENNLPFQTTENSFNSFDNDLFLETSTSQSTLKMEDELRSNNVESLDDVCLFDNGKDRKCNNTIHGHSNNFNTTANNESLRGDIILNKGGADIEVKNFTSDDLTNESKEIPEILNAKPRKTHIFPSEFECARIQQSIPYQQRCNQKADCEDGTDETGCTCTDYLTTFESNLLCDGKIDCSDGQDEIDCYECENNQYLCKQDQLCIPFNLVCDGERQCPSGEDEIDCLTLSNGKEVFEYNGKPEVNLQGYITKKQGNSWHILCKDTMSIDLQEEDANYVCRYMGFSSANRYSLKHINIRERNLLQTDINSRNRRNVNGSRPVNVVYENTDQGNQNNLARNVIIREPEVIKEHCVPNITKTCMTMYVFCDHTLFTHFEVSDDIMSVTLAKSAEISKENIWPWVAKLYVDGNYKCIGVLIDLSWVLISNSCLHKTVTSHNYISVVLGSQKILDSVIGPYEQTYKVDAKKELYRSKVTLLHLTKPAKYSTMVKPMVISTPYTEDKNSTCIVVEQNERNDLTTLFLKEDYNNCSIGQRCFTFKFHNEICEQRLNEDSGAVISCHSKHGWYPAASYIKKLACDSQRIVAYEIEHLKYELKHIKDIAMTHLQELNDIDNCLGIRCPRGRCVELHDVCNGVPNCEDQSDESKDACQLKKSTCSDSPFQRGCECLTNELKCHNGRCIDKELFKNGHDDCGDGTDEPGNFRCSDYLSRVMPSRLCDGILNCKDRSDEDPSFCKCFAKKSFDCRGGPNNENYCVAMDMVCDGVRDCPNGADERQCLALHSNKKSPSGTGEVIKRSHGVWHSKCYQTQNHTKSELESICRELGFISGHSKQLAISDSLRPYPHNNVIIEDFSDVTLNDETSIKLRNTHLPIAKPVKEIVENCYPLFLECL